MDAEYPATPQLMLLLHLSFFLTIFCVSFILKKVIDTIFINCHLES